MNRDAKCNSESAAKDGSLRVRPTVPLTPPPPVIGNPIARMYHDLRLERAATEPFPPGLPSRHHRTANGDW